MSDEEGRRTIYTSASQRDLFTRDEIEQLRAGHCVRVGSDVYRVCDGCCRVVKVTGWTGGLRLCR